MAYYRESDNRKARNMESKQPMRYLAVLAVGKLDKGNTFRLSDLYSVVYSVYPEECERLGFTATPPIEEKWKKDIRFGLQDARRQGLIRHIGSEKSGRWVRV